MLTEAKRLHILDELPYNVTKWYEMIKANRGNLLAFDTGGYTGEWGPQGKLAMLHQKEIVLNAKDTSNLLSAVGLVRQLSKELDLQTSAYQYALSNLKSDIALLNNQDTLQQEVTIHANFPNVSSRKEIEDAFSNLVNEAAQYANEKRLRGF